MVHGRRFTFTLFSVGLCLSVIFWPETLSEKITSRTQRPLPIKRSATTTATTPTRKEYVCDGVNCTGSRYCAVDVQLAPECVCSDYCQNEYYYPVCGSDNRSYDGYCSLDKQSCLTNTIIVIKSWGKCEVQANVCDGFVCPNGRRCVVDPTLNQPVCVCSKQYYYCYGYSPICGTDNQTYANTCELNYPMCVSQTNITVAYAGQCYEATNCDGITCPADRKCTIDEKNSPICVCNTTCSDINDPVCGSDGTTYKNDCRLKTEACVTGVSITVSHRGLCYEGSPCEGITCPPWKQCTVNDRNQGICVCLESCPYYGYNQVCGSDGVTYSSECYLHRSACLNNRNITVDRIGSCYSVLYQCSNVSCPSGKQCKVNADNSTSCVCIDNCYNYFSPVCGSNNKTYDNECILREEACKTNTNITVSKYGFCGTEFGCERFDCPYPKHCELDDERRPSCVCNQICYDYYSPVCGFDNRTYYNYCDLYRTSCLTNSSNNYGVKYGRCDDANQCFLSCPYGMICLNASCICDENCPTLYSPVCGTDNITYDNDCLLRLKACRTNTTITVAHYATCGKGPSCEELYCRYDQHCELDEKNNAQCVCNKAYPKYYDPICGSNNKTYNNSIQLQNDACSSNRTIAYAYAGTCEKGPGCSMTYCPYGKYCVVDEENRPSCVCSLNCWYYYYNYETEVCGSDNKTYVSYCLMQAAACLTNQSITTVPSDFCRRGDPCEGVICDSGRSCAVDEQNRPVCVCNDVCSQYSSPVCGSNKKTYLNYCELQKAACFSNRSINVLYYDRCTEGSVCDGVNCSVNSECAVAESGPVCVCPVCDTIYYSYSPVCGSNNVTYGSECELRRAACLTNSSITVASSGICRRGPSCVGVQCSFGRYCAINEQNQPVCVCTENCYWYYYPVCGSDGQTYTNVCFLNKEACFTNTNITVAYYDQCMEETTTLTPIVSSFHTKTKPRCAGNKKYC